MDLYDATIPVFRQQLANVDRWLDKATEHAKARGFDPETFVTYRLAPDQFALARQVQAACDASKWAAAKLTNKEAPSIPDDEKTIADLKKRLATAIAYLDSFRREDFAGAEERLVQHQWMQGKKMIGTEYVMSYALHNFFFHIVTAYAILRQGGVPVGKLDFIGPITLR